MGHYILPIAFCIASALLVIITYAGTHSQIRESKRSEAHPVAFSPPKEAKERKSYKEWKNCAESVLNPLKDDFEKVWNSAVGLAQKCGHPLMKKVGAKEFRNKDETKYHIMPKDGNTTVVTLGIGHDIVAEEKLRDALGKNKVEFFGADPMVEINEELYSSIGQFFPFAVGANAGISTASVLEEKAYYYHEKLVVHIDFIYFLKHFAKRNFIDQLLLDAEGAEFGLYPFFYKNGEFDKHNIVICQINVEIHYPTLQQKQLTHDFFYKILEDERYAILDVISVGHLRTYMLNMEHPKCVEKYSLQ